MTEDERARLITRSSFNVRSAIGSSNGAALLGDKRHGAKAPSPQGKDIGAANRKQYLSFLSSFSPLFCYCPGFRNLQAR